MVCLAPRALGDSVRPRRLSGVVVRPLNFTARRLCIMGFTVYASCYVRKNSQRAPAAIEGIRRLKDKSLLVPGADPIFVNVDSLTILEPVPDFEKAAWLFSKVQFALNPPLAEAIFITRLCRLARQFGDDVHVHLSDDGGDIGDAKGIHVLGILMRVLFAILQTPIWLFFFLQRLLR